MVFVKESSPRKNPPGAVFAYIIICIGACALVGWFMHFPVVKSFVPELAKVNPTSCLMFILSAVALLNIRPRNGTSSFMLIPAILVCIVSALKLSVFLTGWDSHIDTLFFLKNLDQNRMAPNTAVNFLLGGLAVFLVSRKQERSIIIGQVLALFCLLISMLAIMGYIYSISSLYVVEEFIPMAMHTATCFILLSFGIFAAKAHNGLMSIISAPRLGGTLGRRLLPFAILVPMALGWLHFEVARAGILSENLSVSILIVIIILAFSIVIWMYARSLNRIDAEQREMAKSLTVAKNIAEKARLSQEQFLANMSHEIRTPMNGVIGMTSLLQGTLLNGDQQSYVETIRISGESLLVIINDILDFSKIQAGKLELEQRPFSIHSAIEETFDLMAAEANKKNLELVYTLESSVPEYIIGDVTRLRQILVNLVSNAIKFTEKGEILVSAAVKTIDHDTFELEFKVKDTGIGIAEDKIERLFKAFSQADESTTRKYGGTGLGLAICTKLVQIMNGSIGVESKTGQGSTFYFTIKAQIPEQAIETDKQTLGNLPGKKALIVDDNQTNLLILQKNCESWGLEVSACRHGAEAIALATAQHYDLIITDMMMPEMDGLDVARAIKESTLNRHTPIILLSSSGKSHSTDIGRNKLLSVSLMKPLRPAQLGKVLNGLLDEHDDITIRKDADTPLIEGNADLSEKIPLRILVAEDNMINQKIALRILEKLGYYADLAANGLETIDAIKRQPYDMILMDIIMPEMDGLEATREIRKMNGNIAQPVVIALTANAMQGEKEKCIESGMNDFLPKPFQIGDIEKIILKWSNARKVNYQ